MRLIDADKLNMILDKHSKWLNGREGGEVADLYRANLSGADLSGADLSGANLYRADLSGANLSGANLYRANLSGADLSGANLSEANLSGADLSGANLYRANLSGADLSGADLSGANLSGANLYRANLSGADLYRAIVNWPIACPSDGAFVAWKKVKGMLVKLLIPEDAERCSATTNKCRCNKALVLNITDIESGNEVESVMNTQYSTLLYEKGKMVYPDSWDGNRWNECTHGIHFFVDKQAALNCEREREVSE